MTIAFWLPFAQVASILAMLTATGFATRYLGRRRRAELELIDYRLGDLLRRIVLLEAARRNVAQINQALIDNESLRFRLTALEHAYDLLDVKAVTRPPGNRPAPEPEPEPEAGGAAGAAVGEAAPGDDGNLVRRWPM